MSSRSFTQKLGRPSGRFLFAAFVTLSAVAAAQADLCVVSLATNQVLRYDETTGAPTGLCASGGGLSSPLGVAVGPDGNVYVSSTGNHSVLRYHGASGAFIDAFVPSGSGGLYEPQGLTFGPDGNLYVASFIWVLRYDGQTGAFIDIFANNVFGGVFGLTFGPDGHLYVGTFGNVQRFDGTTGVFMDVFASTGFAAGTGLAFGADQNLYVGSALSNEVVQFNGATGAFMGSFVNQGSGGLSGPLGVAFGPDGRLYVASRDSDSVIRYDQTTGGFIDAFVAPGSGGLDVPVFFAFTPAPSVVISGASASPAVLWPPNHQAVNVTVNYTATNNSGSVDCALGPVTANETLDPSDWAVLDAHHVRLASERTGTGIGRLYTIPITCVDSSGSTATEPVIVNVPHDKHSLR